MHNTDICTWTEKLQITHTVVLKFQIKQYISLPSGIYSQSIKISYDIGKSINIIHRC